MDKSLKEALETLRARGYKISPQKLARFKKKGFTPKRKDVQKFRSWLEWSAQTGGKFVVAVAGVDRHTVTFHTLKGYEHRKQHAAEMVAKKQGG